MTEEPIPVADSPRQLLSATRELTRRVRRAQRGTWFPLLLLGLVVLAATPFYRIGPHSQAVCGPVTATRGPAGAAGRACFIAVGWPAFGYWIVALVLAYVAIAGFYVLRARRRGGAARIRPYVLAGLAGVLVDAALWPWQEHLGQAYIRSHDQAALLAVHGLSPLPAIGIVAESSCRFLAPLSFPETLVLAWAERSRALLAFAAGYLAAALLPGLYSITRLLAEHGWAVPREWHFLPGLWLAGGVLLLGGGAFAVAERARR